MINQAVIADPFAEITIEPRIILPIGQPDPAKQLQAFLRRNSIGQVDDLVDKEQDIAPVTLGHFSPPYTVSPEKIPGALIHIQLCILRHIGEKGHVVTFHSMPVKVTKSIPTETLVEGIT